MAPGLFPFGVDFGNGSMGQRYFQLDEDVYQAKHLLRLGVSYPFPFQSPISQRRLSGAGAAVK